MTRLGTCFPLAFPYNVKSQLCFHCVRHTKTSQCLWERPQERRCNLNSRSVLLLCANVYIVPGRCLQRPQPDSCPTQTNPSHTRDKSKKKEKEKKYNNHSRSRKQRQKEQKGKGAREQRGTGEVSRLTVRDWRTTERPKYKREETTRNMWKQGEAECQRWLK